MIMIRLLVIFMLILALPTMSWGADFEKGLGAFEKKDYAIALQEFRPLGEQGDAEAQHYLGVMYHNGYGVPEDFQEAMKWYRRAAEQGSADSQINIAYMYRKGQGVPQDDHEAVKWYRRAAEQGDMMGQYLLGSQYAYGQGVSRNLVLAYMWATLSTALGNEFFVKHLTAALVATMTPAQIAEAQQLARECVKKNYKGCDEHLRRKLDPVMNDIPILDKESAIQMFGLSSNEWEANVAILQELGVGRPLREPDGSLSLIYARAYTQGGLLGVTPSYKPDNVNRPFKIAITVVCDTILLREKFETISFDETKFLIEETARNMRPEFSLMGYLFRTSGSPPIFNFTIFEQGTIPTIDRMVSLGNVCPLQNGKQNCIRETLIGTPSDEKRLLDNCVAQANNSDFGIGKKQEEIIAVCSCVGKMAKLGMNFEEVQQRCLQ